MPAIVLSTDLFEGVSMELFYQLLWRPVNPDASGSFFSDSDIVGGGSEAVISLGQFGEDPDGQRVFNNSTRARASAAPTPACSVREESPSDEGQYGIRLNYFADWLNEGTELGFYFLNYHSRLPYGSLHATNDSCARDPPTCRRRAGRLPRFQRRPAQPGLRRGPGAAADRHAGRVPGVPGRHPDVRPQLQHQHRHLVAGRRVLVPPEPAAAGTAVRPGAGGVQPAFPANQLAILQTPGGVNDIETLLQFLQQAVSGGTAVDPTQIPALIGALPGLLNDVLPAAEDAVPSFVVRYRGIDRVAPNQYLRGWERPATSASSTSPRSARSPTPSAPTRSSSSAPNR